MNRTSALSESTTTLPAPEIVPVPRAALLELSPTMMGPLLVALPIEIVVLARVFQPALLAAATPWMRTVRLSTPPGTGRSSARGWGL